MPTDNDFLPFAVGGTANVITQAEYEALAATLLATGFTAGTADSKKLNKVWRQSSIMSAVLSQFICDLTGQDAIDDGTTATLLASLKYGLSALANSNTTVGGTANAITLTPNPAITAYVAGQQWCFVASGNNTISAPTIAVSGLAPLPTTQGSVALPVGGLISGNLYKARIDVGSASVRVAPYDAVSVNGDTMNGILALFDGSTVPTPAQLDDSTKIASTAFVKNAGFLFNGNVNQYATSATLPASAAGGISQFTGAITGQTITLPNRASVSFNSVITLSNYGTVPVSVAGNGAETIVARDLNFSPLIIQPGDSVILSAGVGDYWFVIGGTALNAIAYSFRSALVANGYQRLPSGLFVQWGTASASGSADITVTFPIAFPTGGLSVVASAYNTPTTSSVVAGVGSLTTTAFSLGAFTSNTAARVASGVTWVAIGY